MRPWFLLLAACGSNPPTTTITGDAFEFAQGVDGRIVGAHVSVLEDSSIQTTTAAKGHFELAVPLDRPATLVMDDPDYVIVQTQTFDISGPLEQVTFQAVSPALYDVLAMQLGIVPDPTDCQLVTTVTRVGGSLYVAADEGEPDVVVSVDPPIAGGPIYFNATTMPDRTLTASSTDGGVLWVNVPPGDYTITGTKAGVTLRPVNATCRAGVLVNASPPWGLQVE